MYQQANTMKTAISGMCGYQTPDTSPQGSPDPLLMSKSQMYHTDQQGMSMDQQYGVAVGTVVKQEYKPHQTLPTPEMSPVEQTNSDSFSFEENGSMTELKLPSMHSNQQNGPRPNPVKQLCTKFSTESGYLKDVKNPYQERFNLPSNIPELFTFENDDSLKGQYHLDSSNYNPTLYANTVPIGGGDQYSYMYTEANMGLQQMPSNSIMTSNQNIHQMNSQFYRMRQVPYADAAQSRLWCNDTVSTASDMFSTTTTSVIHPTPAITVKTSVITARDQQKAGINDLCISELFDPNELVKYLEPGDSNLHNQVNNCNIKMERISPSSSPQLQYASNSSQMSDEMNTVPSTSDQHGLIDALRETSKIIM